jgi:hypothetical protein
MVEGCGTSVVLEMIFGWSRSPVGNPLIEILASWFRETYGRLSVGDVLMVTVLLCDFDSIGANFRLSLGSAFGVCLADEN